MGTGDHDELIRSHYREQAAMHGASSVSTMEDDVVRDRETELVLGFVGLLTATSKGSPLRILDLGSGNGYTLSLLTERYPQHQYWGVDFSEELLAIAEGRNLTNCHLSLGDARALDFEDAAFDAVFTQRCLINILDADEQCSALREIARVLILGGQFLMIECFTDGLANVNKARLECELPEISAAYHNRYLEKDRVFMAFQGLFTASDPAQLGPEGGPAMLPANFLSSHYFVTRVFFPFIAGGKWKRNTEFAKFFSFLPPMGNYSPIQAYVLKKTGSSVSEREER